MLMVSTPFHQQTVCLAALFCGVPNREPGTEPFRSRLKSMRA